ncbi:MAG: PqqD family protein [Anaerolineae bacterium]|nr:PqqD family protein [Anaerolineae bacterium]
MLTSTDILALALDVVSRQNEGELVVVLPQSGKFFVLNGTGAEIFQRLDGERTLAEIAVALHAGYEDIPLARVQTDVLALAQKLLARGAVRAVTS